MSGRENAGSRYAIRGTARVLDYRSERSMLQALRANNDLNSSAFTTGSTRLIKFGSKAPIAAAAASSLASVTSGGRDVQLAYRAELAPSSLPASSVRPGCLPSRTSCLPRALALWRLAVAFAFRRKAVFFGGGWSLTRESPSTLPPHMTALYRAPPVQALDISLGSDRYMGLGGSALHETWEVDTAEASRWLHDHNLSNISALSDSQALSPPAKLLGRPAAIAALAGLGADSASSPATSSRQVPRPEPNESDRTGAAAIHEETDRLSTSFAGPAPPP